MAGASTQPWRKLEVKWIKTILTVFLLLTVFSVGGMLVSAGSVAYADEPGTGESNVVIDICVTGKTQVHLAATDGTHIDVGAQGAADAQMHFIADADTVFDICITGDGEADIDVSGPCEVNVRVEGPAKVNIDAGDEVRLNVEASDESQVFVDDQRLDNPAQKPEESQVSIDDQKPDEPTGYQESVVPIISGVFPAAGLLAFFLIRRRAKNNINNEGR